MYEIRHAGVKGVGVFSTQRIQRGTRLMAERPLLTVTSEKEVYGAVRALPEHDRKFFMRLATSPVRRSSALGWTEAAWHASRQALSSILSVAQGDGKATVQPPDLNSILEYPTVLNIFRNNNFMVENGKQMMFREVSRINHACVPNAQGNFNTTLGCFTIHAVRPIEQDEEVTLSYLAEQGSVRNTRQGHLMNHYGFLCDCPACDSESLQGRDVESRRQKLRTMLQVFAEGAEGERPSEETNLGVTRCMIETYEAAGTAGREVATMYLSAAELAAKLGKKDEALLYAEKGLRMERHCVGADSPMFGGSLARVQAVKAQFPS